MAEAVTKLVPNSTFTSVVVGTRKTQVTRANGDNCKTLDAPLGGVLKTIVRGMVRARRVVVPEGAQVVAREAAHCVEMCVVTMANPI